MFRQKACQTYFALVIFLLIPFLADIVKMRLLSQIPDTSGFSVSGHMEWFDLINETLQAFLVVPLYRLFSVHREKMGRFLSFTVCTASGIYLVFSIVILCCTGELVSAMNASASGEILTYLRLETAAFIMGFFSSIALAYFAANRESACIWIASLLKTAGCLLSFSVLIPVFGVNGVALSNRVINASLSLCMACVLLRRKKSLPGKPCFDRHYAREWGRIGFFSGLQVFLDNFIYAVMVCRMVNEVSGQGTYWAVNNIIWGLFLVPFLAMSELLRTQTEDTAKTALRKWKPVLISVYVLWTAGLIFADPIVRAAAGSAGRGAAGLLRLLLLYYTAYGLTAVFDGLLTARGKTSLLALISVIVNIGYYGIVYLLFRRGAFRPTIWFAAHMFGIGMIVHLAVSLFLFRKELFSENG